MVFLYWICMFSLSVFFFQVLPHRFFQVTLNWPFVQMWVWMAVCVCVWTCDDLTNYQRCTFPSFATGTSLLQLWKGLNCKGVSGISHLSNIWLLCNCGFYLGCDLLKIQGQPVILLSGNDKSGAPYCSHSLLIVCTTTNKTESLVNYCTLRIER